ncbi:MAG: histone deacetylase [Gemmatimonadetes bacterium]|nr:histone deacetylase [Gemmatimonadota bacterium]
MRAWSSADYDVPLPEGHRFPARKYRMIRDAVVARGILMRKEVLAPERSPRSDLARVHTDRYLDAMEQGTLTDAEQRRLGFPWSAGLLERSTRTVQATVEAARDALRDGAGVTLAGGTHHAFPDHGEGFCCFNDVAVATRVLRASHPALRTVVIDLDVHQGNGTAAVFADDPDSYTFSMHGAKNFPFKKERSSRDVELDDGTGDREYLALLDRHLGEVLDEARADLAFYLAGSDPYAGDRFGRLQLSKEGLARRDRAVFTACRARGLPVVLAMSGGYAPDLADIAEIHATSVHELRAICG